MPTFATRFARRSADMTVRSAACAPTTSGLCRLEVPGRTVNRLCGSGLDAVGTVARAIRADEAEIIIAGGVESMSRAPFVVPKAESPFSRSNAVYDTTIGWRFVDRLMAERYGVDSILKRLRPWPSVSRSSARPHRRGRRDSLPTRSRRPPVSGGNPPEEGRVRHGEPRRVWAHSRSSWAWYGQMRP